MTEPDFRDDAPGMGDPTRSDDIDSDGLRSDVAGSGAGIGVDPGAISGPAPGGQTPDGEDVQAAAGPGPQTDWLRSAAGDGSAGTTGDAPPRDLDPQDTEARRP